MRWPTTRPWTPALWASRCIVLQAEWVRAPYSERCNPRSRCRTVTVQWSCIACNWWHTARIALDLGVIFNAWCVLHCPQYGSTTIHSQGIFSKFPCLTSTGCHHCSFYIISGMVILYFWFGHHGITAVRWWYCCKPTQSTFAEHIGTQHIGRAHYWRRAHWPEAATLHLKLLSTLMTLPSSLGRDEIILLCTLNHLSLQSILKELFSTCTSSVHRALFLACHSAHSVQSPLIHVHCTMFCIFICDFFHVICPLCCVKCICTWML